MKVAAIVPAAGQGRRLGAKISKSFLTVAGKPLFVHTLQNLLKAQNFLDVILVVEPARQKQAGDILRRYGLKKVRVARGGKTRAESVWNGFRELRKDCALVLIHDAARPCLSAEVLRRTLQAGRKGAAICALPISSTVKRVDPRSGRVRNTEDRRTLYLAQTPQVFRKKLLSSRYRSLGRRAFAATDEAALFDRSGIPVRVVAGDEENLKITGRKDLEQAKRYLTELGARSRGPG